MLGTYNKCCLCVDLRAGSFIIAYLLLIGHSIHFIIGCIHVTGINTKLTDYSNHNLVLMHDDLWFSKLMLSLSLLLMVFELLITVALVNGLHKKIQDQIQMFYVGGFIFYILRIILCTIAILRYAHLMAKLFGIWQWTSLALEVLSHVVFLYFLTVIRSYYFHLRQTESVDRYNVFTNASVQLKINK